MQPIATPPLDLRIRAYGSSARSLLMAILRAVVLEGTHRDRDEVWTSTLVQSLGACGIREQNARQTITRLAETGFIESRKIGARAKWSITAKGRTLIERGQSRAARFAGVQQDWDGQWLVIICSMPEAERDRRRRFQMRLKLNGFGFITPGIAVSTHVERESLVNEILDEFGLIEGSLVLKSRLGAIVDDETLLHRAWDVDEIRQNYASFCDQIAAIGAPSPERKFAAYIELERAWSYVSFTDPELPARLLPPRWLGTKARQLYGVKCAEWRPSALEWFEQIAQDGDV